MIRTCYCAENDMTFIIDETSETLEAVGFYFGEPNPRDIKKYTGNLTAEFDLNEGFYPRGLVDAYCVDDDMTFILEGSANGSTLTLTGFYFGEPNDADTEKFNGSLVAEFDEPVNEFYSAIKAYKSVRKSNRFAFSNKDNLIDRLEQNINQVWEMKKENGSPMEIGRLSKDTNRILQELRQFLRDSQIDALIGRLTQNAKRKQYASARRKFVRK